MTRVLPDFAIIGAQKAGSTGLMRLLDEHPGVFLPAGETRYFRDPWYRFQTRADLEADLAGARSGQRAGIKCPDLLGSPECPARMRADLGEIDLLAVLREPVSRSVSAYFWMVQFGLLPNVALDDGITAILDGAWDATYPRGREIVDYSRYGTNLRRYLEFFPRERLCVLTEQELRAADGSGASAVYAFLGLAEPQRPDTAAPAPRKVVNEGVYHPTRLRVLRARCRFILRPYPGYEGRYVQPPASLPAAVVSRGITAVDRTVLRRVFDNSRPTLRPDVHARLAEAFAPEIAETEQILGRPLTEWSPRTGGRKG